MLGTLLGLVLLGAIGVAAMRTRHAHICQQRADRARYLATTRITEVSNVIIPPTKPRLYDWERLRWDASATGEPSRPENVLRPS